jgi:hypothetical protein
MLTPRFSDRQPRGKKRPDNLGVQIPDLWVSKKNVGYYSTNYAKARIRVRKGCYQYLIWSDGGQKHEFYLGQKKPLPPGGAGAPAAGRSRKGGKK